MTDKIAIGLAPLAQLRILNLSACIKIGDEIALAFTGLTKLQHLDLSYTQVTDKIGNSLKQVHKRLDHLNLSCTEVTYKIGPSLTHLYNLCFLSLAKILRTPAYITDSIGD